VEVVRREPQPNSCTGKERDTESRLDYFGARYYASSMGRWTSSDPSGLYMADPENPQTLNLYSYVGNNPLMYTDPSGLYACTPDPAGANIVGRIAHAIHNAFCDPNDGGSNSGGQSPTGTSSPSAGSSPEPDYNLSPQASPMRFSNPQAAGINAARQALGQTSQKDASGYKYEWGGRLLKDKNGQFTFTNPVTFKDGTHFWASHVMVPFGYRKAGSYHTHAGVGAPGMSKQDAQWSAFQGQLRPKRGKCCIRCDGGK
jgi:RHS repeat-associated protein